MLLDLAGVVAPPRDSKGVGVVRWRAMPKLGLRLPAVLLFAGSVGWVGPKLIRRLWMDDFLAVLK